MKKLKIIILFLIGVSVNFAHAQEERMYNTLQTLIEVNNRYFSSEKFYEKALFFSINMSVDKKRRY